jgi:hypothetical protein
LEELFWGTVVFVGLSRDLAFEDAQFRLSERLFGAYSAFVDQLSKAGVDAYSDWPYCIEAISVAMNIVDLRAAADPLEASPFANSAAEGLAIMQESAREPSAQPPADSKQLCDQFEDEARDARGWPPRQ